MYYALPQYAPDVILVRVRVYSLRLDQHVAADQQQRLLLVQPIHGMNDAGGVRTVVCHCPCHPAPLEDGHLPLLVFRLPLLVSRALLRGQKAVTPELLQRPCGTLLPVFFRNSAIRW
jgi:hypothetical protein